MHSTHSQSQLLSRRIAAAQGKIPCDLLLKNVTYLDVFHACWREGHLGILDGTVVETQSEFSAKRVMDIKKQKVVPGFIDAHVHIESSLMLPGPFERAVLPKGTTTAICDPHEIANVIGLKGIEYFLECASQTQLDLQVMLSSCVPATHLETNGGGTLSASDLVSLASHPQALGLAEMMNVPGVLNGDPEVLKKITSFTHRPIDGHCPLLKGPALSAYAAAGITSCHESSELDEASEKLSKGMAVWIREGSVAKDLHRLAPLLNLATSTSIGFCTDDRHPYDILQEGHLDFLVRESLKKEIPETVVYRAASWSVARHYGLDRGFKRRGAIAPGFEADLVVLGDSKTCSIRQVFKSGQDVAEIEFKNFTAPENIKNTVRTAPITETDLTGPQGRVHVIRVLEGKIITDREIKSSEDRGVARLSVLERHGQGHRPANGYVSGFGENLEGAIASSVGHDSHNLIAAGKDTKSMKVALDSLKEVGGGFSIVKNQKVIARLPLPYAGLMSTETPAELKTQLSKLREASQQIGCVLKEPFLQLAFLSLPVIPKLKLTNLGLVDVEKFELISVQA